MVTAALWVRLEAKPGREEDVANFLRASLRLVQKEPATTAWFAVRLGPSTFGIFGVFPDNLAREVHLLGPVAAAIDESSSELFVQRPTIEKADVRAAKLSQEGFAGESRNQPKKEFSMRSPSIWVAAFLSVFLIMAMAYVVTSRASSLERERAGDWLYVDHDPAGTRYSPLKQITPGNVGQLQKVCSYSFPDKEPSQTAPIVSGGSLYLTTAHYTVGLDAFDCRMLWTSKWSARDYETLNTQRGPALSEGKIIRGTGDGFLVALDAKDGHLIWATQIANPHQGYFISMPPLVHDGLVYIGPAGSEWAAKGWVGAFRLSDGGQAWKFNIVPDESEPAAETWGRSPAALRHGGGNLWTPLSFDEEKGLLYVPGGNAAPDFYDDGRPGANLYTNSLIALDAKTGRLVWYKQFIPHDVRDYDVTHVSPIFKTNIGGTIHSTIAASGKDGILRVLDRDTHQVIYSVPFTTRLNAEGTISTTPMRVCPGTLGGQEWNGSAYSPAQNVLFVPTTDWCAQIKKDNAPPDPEKEHTHGWYFGGETKFDPWTEARGRLTAFDASSGTEKWRYDAPKPMIGAVTATEGGVVFSGELSGNLIAFDAASGKVLLRSPVPGPVAGGVVSYAARGLQSIAAVSGYVGIYNNIASDIGGGNTTVTVFRLATK